MPDEPEVLVKIKWNPVKHADCGGWISIETTHWLTPDNARRLAVQLLTAADLIESATPKSALPTP